MAQEVTFEYTNHEGVTSVRTVMIDRISWWDEPDFGYAPGWFATGFCLDRQAIRSFKMDPAHMRPVPGVPLSGFGHFILAQVR